MTVDILDPTRTGDEDNDDESEESRIEKLVLHRRELQDRLAILSVNLCNITKSHNACIADIINTSALLHAAGVDTEALARELQAGVVHPASL